MYNHVFNQTQLFFRRLCYTEPRCQTINTKSELCVIENMAIHLSATPTGMLHIKNICVLCFLSPYSVTQCIISLLCVPFCTSKPHITKWFDTCACANFVTNEELILPILKAFARCSRWLDATRNARCLRSAWSSRTVRRSYQQQTSRPTASSLQQSSVPLH